MSDEADNVISLDGRSLPGPFPATVGQGRKCQHKRVTADPKSRTVECSACGATVDAFDALIRIAEWYRMEQLRKERWRREEEERKARAAARRKKRRS